MIKTIDELWKEIQQHIWHHKDGTVMLGDGKQVLKEWGDSIVDECSQTFQWEWDYPESPSPVEIVDPDTIIDVKKQIQ